MAERHNVLMVISNELTTESVVLGDFDDGAELRINDLRCYERYTLVLEFDNIPQRNRGHAVVTYIRSEWPKGKEDILDRNMEYVGAAWSERMVIDYFPNYVTILLAGKCRHE